jgi:hypothetical protein
MRHWNRSCHQTSNELRFAIQRPCQRVLSIQYCNHHSVGDGVYCTLRSRSLWLSRWSVLWPLTKRVSPKRRMHKWNEFAKCHTQSAVAIRRSAGAVAVAATAHSPSVAKHAVGERTHINATKACARGECRVQHEWNWWPQTGLQRHWWQRWNGWCQRGPSG